MKPLFQRLAILASRLAAFLSVGRNLLAVLLGAAFLLSLGAWGLGDRFDEVVLYFPGANGGEPGGELRSIPRTSGTEAFAELIVSESLLGPTSPGLASGFGQGARLESILIRQGRAYVDISEEAALGDPILLKKSLGALERSLRGSISSLSSVRIAIGGQEPYADQGSEGPSDPPKSEKMN